MICMKKKKKNQHSDFGFIWQAGAGVWCRIPFFFFFFFFVVAITVKILTFGTPQTTAIIVLKIEKFDVTLH